MFERTVSVEDFLEGGWRLLRDAAFSRTATERQLALATVSPDGHPQVRTVVLRSANQDTGRLTIFTDVQSRKVTELSARPEAEILFWSEDNRVQLRLKAKIEVLNNTDAWKNLNDEGRLSYGKLPVPGTPIERADGFKVTSDPAAFAVLSCDLRAMDVLYLGDQHKRAVFERAGDGWAGTWIVP